MKRYLQLVSTLTTVLILSAGCLDSSGNMLVITPISVPTTTGTAQTSPTPTNPPQATSAQTAAPVANDALATALIVEEVPEIQSYRMHFYSVSEGSIITNTIEIEGTFVKSPHADQILINFAQGGESIINIETLLVDGIRYVREGRTWRQQPESPMEIMSLVSFMPNSVGLEGQMENIGTETVNGYTAYHYRGSKETIPVERPPSDMMFDVSRYGSVQVDLWVDETYNAIIRLSLRAVNRDPLDGFILTYDYFDLNSDIQIVAP